MIRTKSNFFRCSGVSQTKAGKTEMGQPGSVRNKLLRQLDVAAHINDVAFFAGTEHPASLAFRK